MSYRSVISARPENVRIVERVPFWQVEGYMRGAWAFINTSIFEGSANTYLQAGKYGVPVLVLEREAAGFVGECGCGLVANGSVDRLREGLLGLQHDDALRITLSTAIARQVRSRHDLPGRIDELGAALSTLRRSSDARNDQPGDWPGL
jgi:glycosyltransferase involved in cell wall biosynthesis